MAISIDIKGSLLILRDKCAQQRKRGDYSEQPYGQLYRRKKLPDHGMLSAWDEQTAGNLYLLRLVYLHTTLLVDGLA